MELTLFPWRKTNNDAADGPLADTTHEVGAPCPFTSDSSPYGPRCCSLDGDALRNAIQAFGEDDCAEILSSGIELNATHTSLFSVLLRSLVERIEYQYEGQPKWNGGHRVAWLNLYTGKRTPWPPEAVEMLTTMRTAADWFEKVGRLGFGVRAKH